MSKLKHFYSQHKDAIFKIVGFILATALFFSGFFLTSKFFKPITEEQITYFEEVAKDIYSQGAKSLYEVPDDVFVSKNDFSITVSSNKARELGSVTATLENGKLNFTNNAEKGDAIFACIMVGILFILVPMAIVLIIAIAHDKYLAKKRNNNS